MTITDGISALIISKIRFDIQYAVKDIPEMICICFRFFSLSFRINEITTEGIKANAIDTMNDMNIPLADAALFFSLYVTGYGVVTKFKLNLDFPVAALITLSYRKWGYAAVTSGDVKFKKTAALYCLVWLFAS